MFVEDGVGEEEEEEEEDHDQHDPRGGLLNSHDDSSNMVVAMPLSSFPSPMPLASSNANMTVATTNPPSPTNASVRGSIIVGEGGGTGEGWAAMEVDSRELFGLLTESLSRQFEHLQRERAALLREQQLLDQKRHHFEEVKRQMGSLLHLQENRYSLSSGHKRTRCGGGWN